jgi:ABC-type sugar transport system substrate-binding protein
MAPGRVAVCLVDSDNEFQQVAREDAETAARRVGLDVETLWSGSKLSAQLAQLRELVDSSPPPSAILVMAVRDQGLGRIAGDAARAGIHWIFLNRSEDNIESLRVQHRELAICQVYPDEVETGRVQARLVQALLPEGGKVLQVQGSMRSVAARDRSAGTAEALDSSRFKIIPLEAGWTEDEGYNALIGWLRVAVRANMRFDAVACHNDLLARGARRALVEVARDLEKPALTTVPIVGCDGTPSVGQTMVNQGEIAATVVLPRSSGPAVEIIGRALKRQGLPDAVVTLHATPFPDPSDLSPLSA